MRRSMSAAAMGDVRDNFSLTLDEEDVTQVAFGKNSVFDIYVESHEDIPFQLPTGEYLEEVLIGLNAAPEFGGKKDDQSPQTVANYRRLRRVVSAKALCDACQALFWIAVGIITSRVVNDVVDELRSTLSKAWCLVVLQVKKEVHRDHAGADAQDFLLGALPAILVQTIYRLLVDCFPEDKIQFIHHVDALLEKLSHVVSYEVCGFQLNVETSHKERKQLFRRVVLDNPFVNQRDSVKALMRTELLSKADHTPLRFGNLGDEGGQPLEETQLEHVMLNHETLVREGSKQRRDNPLSPSPVPEDLSVERYNSIAMQSGMLFNRQLQELMPRKPSKPSRVLPAVDGARCQSRGSSQEEGSRCPSRARATTDGFDTVVQKNPSRARATTDGFAMQKNTNKRGSMALQHAGGKIQNGRSLLSTQRIKDFEQAEKRKREDLLVKRICAEPLPPELCERALDTTWVSPITNRLAPGERDRQALRKCATEAHHLKMAPMNKTFSGGLPLLMPKPRMQKMQKSRSAPELRDAQQELPKLPGPGFPGPQGRRCSIIAEPPGVNNDSPTTSPSASQRRCWDSNHTNEHQNHKIARDNANRMLKEKGDMSATLLGGSPKAVRLAVAEDLILAPPPSMQREDIMHRLQAAGEAFADNSFGNYAKEFDITTGEKKHRMDEDVMRKHESTYVKNMEELVGPPEQPALKMYDSPLQMANRRTRQAKPKHPARASEEE